MQSVLRILQELISNLDQQQIIILSSLLTTIFTYISKFLEISCKHFFAVWKWMTDSLLQKM